MLVMTTGLLTILGLWLCWEIADFVLNSVLAFLAFDPNGGGWYRDGATLALAVPMCWLMAVKIILPIGDRLDAFVYPEEWEGASSELDGLYYFTPFSLSAFAFQPNPLEGKEKVLNSDDLGAGTVVLNNRFSIGLPLTKRFTFSFDTEAEIHSPSFTVASVSESESSTVILAIEDSEAYRSSLSEEEQRLDEIETAIFGAAVFDKGALSAELASMQEATLNAMQEECRKSLKEEDVIFEDIELDFDLEIKDGFRVLVLRGRMTFFDSLDRSDKLFFSWCAIIFLDDQDRTPSIALMQTSDDGIDRELARFSKTLFSSICCKELGILADLQAFKIGSEIDSFIQY